MIIGIYKITYHNSGISQTKSLIRHEDYLGDIKPIRNKIHNLEVEASKLNKKKKQIEIDEIQKQIKFLKSYLIEKYSDNFFTTKSPLWLNCEKNLLSLPFNSSKKEWKNKTFPYSVELVSPTDWWFKEEEV